jgi:hypothetical protein
VVECVAANRPSEILDAALAEDAIRLCQMQADSLAATAAG